MSLRKALAVGVALAFVMSFAGAAEAGYRKSARTAGKPAKKREVVLKDPFGPLPKGPLQMVVSIGQQHVTLYANGERIAQAKVSTGTPGHPTPFGVFSIIEKDRWHRSNLYDAAPMFYMQRLTWSGVAMHEGILPGYAASHGCIRLPTDFASRLWLITKLGVRVVVARNDPTPYAFDHPKLFSPRPKPAPKVTELQPGEGLRPTIATAELSAGKRPIVYAQATVTDDSGHTTDIPEQYEQTYDQSLQQSPDSPEAAPPPPAPPIEAEITTATTKATAKAAEEQPAPAAEAAPPTPPAAVEVTEAPQTAAPLAADAAVVAEPEKHEPVEAEPDKPAPPRKRSSEPTKRAGQVAVFVSKREKKVFVRQGFVPVFDMPIEIADPDQPLGTHVFTVMGFEDDGARVRWNAITMPPDQPRPTNRRGKRKAGQKKPEPAPTVEAKTPSTAAEALDRIKLPQEAIDRISEMLTLGSSLVVSDHGLGRETGRYTEFIVVTP